MCGLHLDRLSEERAVQGEGLVLAALAADVDAVSGVLEMREQRKERKKEKKNNVLRRHNYCLGRRELWRGREAFLSSLDSRNEGRTLESFSLLTLHSLSLSLPA